MNKSLTAEGKTLQSLQELTDNPYNDHSRFKNNRLSEEKRTKETARNQSFTELDSPYKAIIQSKNNILSSLDESYMSAISENQDQTDC
jgi:hypothetical protein